MPPAQFVSLHARRPLPSEDAGIPSAHSVVSHRLLGMTSVPRRREGSEYARHLHVADMHAHGMAGRSDVDLSRGIFRGRLLRAEGGTAVHDKAPEVDAQAVACTDVYEKRQAAIVT